MGAPPLHKFFHSAKIQPHEVQFAVRVTAIGDDRIFQIVLKTWWKKQSLTCLKTFAL